MDIQSVKQAFRYDGELPEEIGEWLISEHDRLTAENATLMAANERMPETLENLLKYAEQQVCPHGDTHRCGFIWEICDQCGMKWADDEGGRPDYEEPAEFDFARQALKEVE